MEENVTGKEHQEPLKGEMMADLLAFIAWLMLISGVGGSIILWNLGVIEVKQGLGVTTTYNLVAIWTGIGLFIGGVVWFVAFKVVVETFRHVVEIQKKLDKD